MKYIIILFIISSCGKRITGNQAAYFKSDSIKIDNSVVLTQNTKLNDISELIPFDNSKPMVIEGKHYYNALIRYDKSKFQDFKIQQEIKVIDVKKESEIKNKATEKKDNSNLWLGIVFIVVIGLVLYFKKI